MATNKQTQNDIQAEIARLRAENERLVAQLAAKPEGKLTLKVSEKGGISVYGLGRFPVTLFGEQWSKLLGLSEDIKAFMTANAPKLARKGETYEDYCKRVGKAPKAAAPEEKANKDSF